MFSVTYSAKMVDSNDSPSVPQALSSCSSGERRNAKSPEFEFWMVRNPINFPQPNLISADELFSDGFLLPLHPIHLENEPRAPPQAAAMADPEETVSDQVPDPERKTVHGLAASSKRWRSIFHKSDKDRLEPSGSNAEDDRSTKEKDWISVVKEKKREKKISGSAVLATGNVVNAAELKINIWPFSRSRSAGNGGNRPRSAAASNRKVSSAPCSRSNSTGESKYRKWPSRNSPSRAGGVYLGRSSPVWKVRRGSAGGRYERTMEASLRNADKGAKKNGNKSRRKIPAVATRGGGSSKARALGLNVPTCIGYRHNLSCKSDENSAVSIAAAVAGGGRGRGGGISGDGLRKNNLLNIRSLFTRKVC